MMKVKMKLEYFIHILQQLLQDPSGSGKTTLLNFLSGRLFSENLAISGELFLNKRNLTSIEEYSNQIAYVMQDDILLSTFTPRESFQFVLQLKKSKLSEQQRNLQIQNLIEELGLQKCADTLIGGGLIKGISGGEKKRTSIGIELLTEPKIIFLDEPTTGLDSSTSLQVINILKKLAYKGMNVIATVHQPSTDLFYNFDNLLLLVQGNIIYQGRTEDSIDFFTKIGFECPESYNPCDFFMKIMNEQGFLMEKMIEDDDQQLALDEDQIKCQFQERLNLLKQNYEKQDKSEYYNQQNIEESAQILSIYKESSFWVQFILISKRFFINILRAKMSLKLQFFQLILFSFLFIIAYYNIRNINPDTQPLIYFINIRGASYFMVNAFAFQSVSQSIFTFNSQKSLYIREKATNLYRVSAFFWGKCLSEFSFQIIFPILFVFINYFIVGFEANLVKFLITNLTMILLAWHGSSYGFLVSILIPKYEVAIALISLIVVPLSLLSGIFESEQSFPIYWRVISYFSLFKYGYQAMCIVNIFYFFIFIFFFFQQIEFSK
ncbi:hypothetical protein IMG5_200060 [Ichthyophthirius multifiliis]|uniref:ABC transporter domain-containing protein n=1 Tax=Ichthyophthirius multifiliis TaxID=5932 RepID=G0R5P7_ICHMU|nr:hypothetical protein IMG5_200060 [Ichthyophthirius multifiliis]EGR27220.1 hypothetical protein IMG5_200060 [Ichthyophthirius multifiliis]|eukprot:XP_004024104.1 hypothetical protein IMG5_200060 [Ichthyophthirius multifiliis]